MDNDIRIKLEQAVLPEDITHRVLNRLASIHGAQAVIDFIKIYEEEYPGRKSEKRRYLHVPTMKTLTYKAHCRLFD